MAAPCRLCVLLILPTCLFISVASTLGKQYQLRANSVQEKERNNLDYRVPGGRKYPNDNRSFLRRRQVGEANLARHGKSRTDILSEESNQVSNSEASGLFIPGDPAPDFTIPTLDGTLRYPSAALPAGTPVLLHAYTPHSAFLRCAWNCSGSLEALVKNSPNNTHYIFLSYEDDAYSTSLWMKARFKEVISKTKATRNSTPLLSRLHFVTVPLYQLGNWVPAVFKQWTCSGHNCGLDQAVFTVSGSRPVITPRLDARYDWLPGYTTGKSYNLTDAQDGCRDSPQVKGHVALVTASGCSYFAKVQTMQRSGAVGVVVVQTGSSSPQDMNCANTSECSAPLQIPATMVTDLDHINRDTLLMVSFQNTVWDNFFFGIDGNGSLAEVGWFLYPSFHFLAWQAQWFGYMTGVATRLAEKALVIPVFQDSIMKGKTGASGTVTLPAKLASYTTFELDLRLSCPGTSDTTCPHWDHTVQLFVCCDPSSPRCGAELGRWISPFRRRIGRWLTNVTSLLPLLDGERCTFTLKTVPWAMPWKPTLNLRFSGLRDAENPRPYMAIPLYSPGATFDSKYNSHFLPYNFKLPPNVTKVEIVSVITGHGSDENGCGEFCVTSHHFVVNDSPPYNITFGIAGSPLGCADQVPLGAEPNEHGTWLYGRDGWCDGQDVRAWVLDITHTLYQTAVNTIRYYGWFNGTDPNPKQNPGEMIVYSYLVYSKD